MRHREDPRLREGQVFILCRVTPVLILRGIAPALDGIVVRFLAVLHGLERCKQGDIACCEGFDHIVVAITALVFVFARGLRHKGHAALAVIAPLSPKDPAAPEDFLREEVIT